MTTPKTIRSRRRITLITAAALLLLLALWGGLRLRRQQINRSQPALRIAVDLSPLDFSIDSIGHLSGLQYDLVRLLLPDTAIRWVPVASREEALHELTHGHVDIYATSYPCLASDSIPDVLKSVPLYYASYTVLRRDGSLPWTETPHTLPIDVYIPRNDHTATLLLKHLQELSLPHLRIHKSMASTQELALLVYAGDIPYTVCSSDLAGSLTMRFEGLIADPSLSYEVPQSWLIAPGQTHLARRLDAHIESAKATDTWQALLQKHGLPPTHQ